MRLGQRRHRATFTERPQSTDGAGQAVGVGPVVIRDVPCALRALSAKEAEQSRQMEASITHIAEIGTGSYEITPYMTMTIAGKTFDIESVVFPDYSAEVLQIRAVERVGL